MNNNDLLNKLLGISKLRVVKSEFIGEEKLHLEVVSTLPVAGCPDCGASAIRCMIRAKCK
ncbi:MAG: hypothetical protein ACOY0R_14515 [Chloroflexota bacterium]